MSEQETQNNFNEAENAENQTEQQNPQQTESAEQQNENQAEVKDASAEEKNDNECVEENIANLTPEQLRTDLLSARLSIKQIRTEKELLKAEMKRKLDTLAAEKATVMSQYEEFKKNAEAEQKDKVQKLMEVTQKKLNEALQTRDEEIKRIQTRSENEIAKAKSFALEGFIKDLIPSLEPLEQALFYADRSNEAQKDMINGLEMTFELILKAISKNGVQVLDPKGEPFDPNFHQAIQHVPHPNLPANHVINVVQKGYVLNGRVIKPALVVVSRAM